MAETSPGSTRWPTSSWQGLLRDAIGLLDTLSETPPWTFGGGAALAALYGHRVANDVDILLADADLLTALTPARDAATKALLGERGHRFPGNRLELDLVGGQLAFILAGRRTEDPTRPFAFEGRTIQIDTPWEAAIKKIFYRPSSFRVRDVFDLAAVVDRDGEELKQHLVEVDGKLEKLLDRLDALLPSYEQLAAGKIDPTEEGRRYATRDAIEEVVAYLEDWRCSAELRGCTGRPNGPDIKP